MGIPVSSIKKAFQLLGFLQQLFTLFKEIRSERHAKQPRPRSDHHKGDNQ